MVGVGFVFVIGRVWIRGIVERGNGWVWFL